MPKIFHRLVTPEEASEVLIALLKERISEESINISSSGGRIVADDIFSSIDIPPFDRSEVDGYAIVHRSVERAEEDNPVELIVRGEVEIGKKTDIEIKTGEAAYISTGATIPRGADSVVMVEYTSRKNDRIYVYRSVSPGENISHTGSDFSYGEVLARHGTVINPEIIALLSASGNMNVRVLKKMKVGIISSGNEIKEPGSILKEGEIYDVNSHYFISSLNSTGLVEASFLGIIRDDEEEAIRFISTMIGKYDVIISSGSTSAGFHDMLYEVVEKLFGRMIFHGISIKPGKPTFLAEINGSLFVGMPGFPLSAAAVLDYIVIPSIRGAYGLTPYEKRKKKIPFRINGEKGKDYVIPAIISRSDRAYPIFGDSGSISRLIYADGLIVLSRDRNYYDENEEVTFIPLKNRSNDVLCIGSNDPLLERILFNVFHYPAIINAGSLGGVEAMKIGESDIGGIHLMKNGIYNTFLMNDDSIKNAVLVRGFSREQGFVSRDGIESFREVIDRNLLFVNRNRGSGTRDLIESLIDEQLGHDFSREKIRGYFWEAKSHGAVSRAVSQGRADVGVSIRYYAEILGLSFKKVRDENYDILMSRNFYNSESGRKFLEKLSVSRNYSQDFPGYIIGDDIGSVISK